MGQWSVVWEAVLGEMHKRRYNRDVYSGHHDSDQDCELCCQCCFAAVGWWHHHGLVPDRFRSYCQLNGFFHQH